MPRKDDWQKAMNDVIIRHNAMAFEWGKSDCFAFVMDAVEAMTGQDPYADVRRVKDEAGAKAVYKRHKVRGVDGLLKRAFPIIPPAMAQVGDIALLHNDSGQLACGLVVGSEVVVRDFARLARRPLTAARRAYRVD